MGVFKGKVRGRGSKTYPVTPADVLIQDGRLQSDICCSFGANKNQYLIIDIL